MSEPSNKAVVWVPIEIPATNDAPQAWSAVWQQLQPHLHVNPMESGAETAIVPARIIVPATTSNAPAVAMSPPTSAVQENPRPCSSFENLPPEILMEIFSYFGRPSFSPTYFLSNSEPLNNEIHPCYAICSTSRRLRACFIAAMGPVIKNVKIVLNWDTYLMDLASHNPSQEEKARLENELLRRLELFGPYGLRCINDIHIIGPGFNRTSRTQRLSNWLGGRRVTPLSNDEKAMMKEHVEKDISHKTANIKILFEALEKIFGTKQISFLSIYAGEMPASAWNEGLRKLVFTQSCLREFSFTNNNNHTRYGNYDLPTQNFFPYNERFSSRRWWNGRNEQPSNYPETRGRHRSNFNQLSFCLKDFIKHRKNMLDLRLRDEF